LLLGLWLALGPSPLRAEAEQTAPLTALESELVRGVNAERARHHRIPLLRVPELDRVARAHSADMARRGYLSHHSPEGRNPVDRIRQGAPPGFSLAAENIGITNRAEPNHEILQNWLASPEHRSNLLAPPFNATGIGIAQSADGSLVYTQIYLSYPRVDDR
jgi:uncharacterized protein YkwD